MKPNEKRLVIEIDQSIHRSIKMSAAGKQMTIKGWLISAIAKKLEEEKKQERE